MATKKKIDYDLQLYTRGDAEDEFYCLKERALDKGYILENEVSITADPSSTKGWTYYDFYNEAYVVCKGVNNYSIVFPDYSFTEPPKGFVAIAKAIYGEDSFSHNEKEVSNG